VSTAGRLGLDRARVASAYAFALVVAVLMGWLLARGTLVAAGGSIGWTTHPIAVAATADLVATLIVFRFSFALDNSSVYDPYWSLAPIPIVAYWALAGAHTAGPASETVDASMAGPAMEPLEAFPSLQGVALILLVLIWGVRLTANWVRRWKGLADEDWRYKEYRESAGRAYWAISLGGFHLLPTVLVFFGCVPVYFALAAGARSLGVLNALALALTSGGIWLEWTADRELRRFLRSDAPGGSLLTTGPWAWCRHPNYLGELLFWWGLALAGLAASPGKAAWSLTGAVAISALFALVSLPMMERRLARKPGFTEYARRTPRLFPRPFSAHR
jgi:steroid 5-alpha reductase family enzyme